MTVFIFFTDSRTRGWPLVDSPAPTLLYTAVYLFIVWLGPKLMKNRKPFRLTWLLIPYNLAMALLNAYIAVQVSVICLSINKYKQHKGHITFV